MTAALAASLQSELAAARQDIAGAAATLAEARLNLADADLLINDVSRGLFAIGLIASATVLAFWIRAHLKQKGRK